MTTAASMAPLSSPLTVRRKKQVLQATDSSGGLVLDGRSDGDYALVCTTAAGQWHIQRTEKKETGKVNTVTDGAGREVAQVQHRLVRSWLLVLPGGESMPITSARYRLNYASRIGDLAAAKAPYLFPQRYVRFTFSDELLNRADREAIAVVGIWATEMMIRSAISTSAVS